MSSRFHRIVFAMTLSAGLAASAASAETIQISAVTFAARESAVVDLGEASFGVLTGAKGTYYAALPFLVNGQRVCKFSLVYRDNDTDSQTAARLLKKRIILEDNPFTPPVLMAFVGTGVATATMGVKRKSTTAINQPILTIPGAFYYVELTNSSGLLEVLGVEIDVKPVC